MQNVLSVANEILSTFKSSGKSTMSQESEMNGSWAIASIRYWGMWEMPEGEEDDGDYDWEVLSEESYKSAKNIIDTASKKYPELKIVFGTEEKNWISIQVSNK